MCHKIQIAVIKLHVLKKNQVIPTLSGLPLRKSLANLNTMRNNNLTFNFNTKGLDNNC